MRLIAAVTVGFTLTLAEQGQKGAQLGHCDGAVVPIAGQQVLEHLSSRLGLVFPQTCHYAQRAEQHSQGQSKHHLRLEESSGGRVTAMRGPDEHGFFTGWRALICGERGSHDKICVHVMYNLQY